jgi:hypothetical protein
MVKLVELHKEKINKIGMHLLEETEAMELCVDRLCFKITERG